MSPRRTWSGGRYRAAHGAFRGKAGAFYPRLSLENVDAGWSNLYALSSSVINTWIGEELRTIGTEARVVRELPWVTDQQVSFEGALYVANDPTGAALTWRGWAAHDRQTGIFGCRSRCRIAVRHSIRGIRAASRCPRLRAVRGNRRIGSASTSARNGAGASAR